MLKIKQIIKDTAYQKKFLFYQKSLQGLCEECWLEWIFKSKGFSQIMNWTKGSYFEKENLGEQKVSLRHDIKHPSENIESGYTIWNLRNI